MKLSHTAVLVRHPTFSGLLGGAESSAQRMEIVKMARLHATMTLNEAVKRIPVEKPSIIAAYKAKGKNLVWMLGDNDDAVRFWLTLPSHDHTPEEKEAADLLRSCVAADELGDVPEFKLMHAARAAEEQRTSASKKMRPGRRDPLRERLRVIFSKERKADHSLDAALHGWKGNQIDGLRLTYDKEKNVHVIDDENASGNTLRSFTYRQLRTIFTEAS